MMIIVKEFLKNLLLVIVVGGSILTAAAAIFGLLVLAFNFFGWLGLLGTLSFLYALAFAAMLTVEKVRYG